MEESLLGICLKNLHILKCYCNTLHSLKYIIKKIHTLSCCSKINIKACCLDKISIKNKKKTKIGWNETKRYPDNDVLNAKPRYYSQEASYSKGFLFRFAHCDCVCARRGHKTKDARQATAPRPPASLAVHASLRR